MKVVHIESGLGNQMLSYGEYLALKKLHPEEDIYIETIIYDIPECNEVIKQWNGYELQRIFGINAPNLKDVCSSQQWEKIMHHILVSKFWKKNWNYPVHFTKAFQQEGLDITNFRGDFGDDKAQILDMTREWVSTLRERFVDSPLGDWLKRHYRQLRASHFINRENFYNKIFYKGKDNIFTGQWLGLKTRNSGIELVEDDIRKAFVFPDFVNEKDIEMAKLLENFNSVAIHARRGDMLGCNGYCYKYGYFKRAVKFIKKHVDNPLFIFFCDPGSVQWCRENEEIFNLDFKKDKVLFVDWNNGTDSFRDMQLMSHCKHAIITNSSFGWWGSFFINNPNKITISPKQEIQVNTTHHL